MANIIITNHAYSRMKERLGIKKKAADRIVEVAYEEGISHSETSGRLNKYVSDKARAYMTKGYRIRIYGEAVYCFVEKGKKIVLVTVWHIPNNLKNQVIGLQKRKKEGLGKIV